MGRRGRREGRSDGTGERASFRQGFGFGALSVVSLAVLGVLSTFLTARLYGVHIMGEFALASAPVAAVWFLSTLQEQPALIKRLARLPPRAPEVTGLFVPVLAFSVALTALVTLIAVAVTEVVFRGPVGQPGLIAPAVVGLVAYLVVTNTGWNLDAVFSSFRAGRQLFWVRLDQAGSFIAITVALSFTWQSVWALVVATAGSSLLATLHRAVLVRRWMALRVPRAALAEGWRELPEILRFGLKVTPGVISDGISNQAGVWILGAATSVSAVGAYNRAATLGSRLVVLNGRINEMVFPTLVERHGGTGGHDFDRTLMDSLRYVAMGMLLPAAAVGGAARGVMDLFGPGFGEGATALSLIMVVPALATVALMLGFAFYAVDRPVFPTLVSMIKVVATVGLTVALVPPLGVTGAAVGMVSGSVFEVTCKLVVIRGHLSSALHALWTPRQLLALALALVGGFAAAAEVDSRLPGFGGTVLAMLAGAVVYVTLLLAAGALGPRDRRRLRETVGSRLPARARLRVGASGR